MLVYIVKIQFENNRKMSINSDLTQLNEKVFYIAIRIQIYELDLQVENK